MRKAGKTRIEATREAEGEWRKGTNDIYDAFVFSKAKTWYSGDNIPGKKRETLN
jgi:hypothetical protein